MDPVVGEIIKSLPTPLVGAAAIAVVVYFLSAFKSRMLAIEEGIKASKVAQETSIQSLRDEMREQNGALQHKLETTTGALEEKVEKALSEVDKRVTVPDLRETMNQIWAHARANELSQRELSTQRVRDREEFLELRAEVRAPKKGRA